MTSASSNSGKLFEEINSTSNATRHQKFRGLLKRKPIKIFRDDLFRFFDYLYAIAPSHLFFVIIMKNLHFIQIGLLSFLPYSSTLWPDNSLLGQICKVLSVVATIIPVRTNISIHLIFEIIIYFLIASFAVYFFVCFKLFHVYTKISIISIKLITVIMNAFLPYLISITSSNLGLDLFLISTHNSTHNGNSKNYYYQNADYNFAFVIFNFILGWLELILMILCQIIFVTPSLTFRPQVIHILSPRVSFIYLFFIFFFPFTTTFGSIYDGCGGYLSLFFILINIFPLVYLLHNLYIHIEVYVTNELHQTLLSLFHMLLINLIVLLIIARLGNEINEIAILLCVLTFCVSYYVIPFIVDSTHKKNLQILDKIDENESILSKIPTNKYLQLVRAGFDTGHQICHSWKLFKIADRKMAKNKTFLIIFAHYAAIYPDESLMLHYVCKLIQKMKHNSVEMKYLAFQINNLLQQRERGLSKTIKKTCNKISDKTEKCRDQLRLVWQSIMNGSTSDLDDLASQLKKNEDEISREYSQLCFVYPNNPYIASSYSAFLSDILCDDRESEEYAKIYRLLRSGANTRVERSYYFATMMIKTLPDVYHHSLSNKDENNNDNKNNESNNRTTSIAIGNVLANNKQEDINEEKTQQRYIEMLIDSVRLPSIRYGPFLLFFVVSLVYPVLSIPLLSEMISNLYHNKISINLMELFSLMRTHLCQLSMTSYYYALSKNKYVSPLSSLGNFTENSVKTDETIFLSSVNDCIFSLNAINEFYPKLHGLEMFKTTLPYLNSGLISFDVFSSITNKTDSMWSFQHISSFIGLVAVELRNKKNYQMLRFPELRTLVSNSVNILYQSKDVADTFINSFTSMNDNFYYRILYFVVGLGGGMLIVTIIIIVIVSNKMNKEKNMLYDSFKTLPKSTISSIVDKIDAQSGKHVDQETVVQPLSSQEQNAMRILNLSTDRRNHFNQETLLIVIMAFISIIAILFMMIYSTQTQKTICKQFPLMSSTIFDLTRIHSTFFTILLTEMRIAAMNNNQLKSSFPEDVDDLIKTCVDIMKIQTKNLLYLKFGRNSNEIGRFSLTGSDLVKLLTNSPNYDIDVVLDTPSLISYVSLENKIFLIYDLLYQIYADLLFQENGNETENLNGRSKTIENVQINDSRFELILNYLLNEENQTFLYNGLTFIYEKCEGLYRGIKRDHLYLPFIISDVIILVCGTVIVFKFVGINDRAKWTMKLLLFCPANIVFQSQTISKLLSNDFTNSETDENEESSQFYENVVAHFPDPVIFMDTEMRIKSVNDSFFKIFKKDIKNVKNMRLDEVFISSNFLNEIDNIVNEKVPPFYNGSVEVEVNKETFSFEVSLIAVNINGEIQKNKCPIDLISMFTLTMVNKTEASKLADSYRREKESMKKVLSAIIPKNFLNESGQINSENEKLSSSLLSSTRFKVNLVSIVFIRIDGVQSMQNQSSSELVLKLNSIYNEFDKILSNYGELVKVSSISGTFIVAGGVLNDSANSRSGLSFGIDSISVIEKFNAKESVSLTIKVGIDVGGPAVGGVLDIRQPAFELFGRPVSVAMKMEETGVDMKIHVSQAAYESLSREKYVFKEADDVTFKGQTMKTYLL